MSEVKKCPKCDGEMEQGEKIVGYPGGIIFQKRGGDWRGDRIIPFHCKNCGFIEMYKEMKGKK